MKTALFLLFIIFSGSLKAQVQSKPLSDSTKKDSIPALKIYVITLNENELNTLVQLIREADEKPSVISADLNFLLTKTQLITPAVPNKEQPKKQK
jgi:hypothetical protein